MNFQMSREDVEKLLDLKVSAGQMTPQRKAQLMQEYDARVSGTYQQGIQNQQFTSQQYTDQGFPNQQGTAYANPPRIQTSGALGGRDIIIAFILGALIVIAAKLNLSWLVGVATGILFIYIPAILIFKEMKKEKKHLGIPIIFVICGVLMFAYGIFDLVGSNETKASFDDFGGKMVPFIMILVGIGMLVGHFINRNRLKKYCTQPVQATCVELIRPRSGHNTYPRRFTPLYEFYYNGEYKRLMNGTITSRGYPQAGEVREIYIDPVHLDEYYDPKMLNGILINVILLSTFFIGMGLLCVILLLMNNVL